LTRQQHLFVSNEIEARGWFAQVTSAGSVTAEAASGARFEEDHNRKISSEMEIE
jgi:hypothetical protein